MGDKHVFSDIPRFLQIDPWPLVPGVVFWLALMLVAGALIGELVFRRFSLPRIVGYSAVGMLAALLGQDASTRYASGPLRVVIDLALGLLLFELGSRVNLRWLRNNRGLWYTSAAETLLGFGAMFAALHWILDQSLQVSLICATMGVAASAAVVGRVASEMRAAGQVTERMIVLTALNTLVAVLAHKLVIGWLHLDSPGNWVQGISQPLYAFGGSVLVAALLYRLVAWIARHLDWRDENSALLLLGLIVLALTVASMLNLSTLLVPLLAGVLLRNTSERPWIWPRHFGSAGGVMVLMLFVIVGASWTPQALATGGVAAVVLLLARGAAKGVAVFGLSRWSGITTRQSAGLTLALTPLSGTALVLLAELQLSHPQVAGQVAPIIFSAIAIMEIIGPIVLQWGLRHAGEVVQDAARRDRTQARREPRSEPVAPPPPSQAPLNAEETS